MDPAAVVDRLERGGVDGAGVTRVDLDAGGGQSIEVDCHNTDSDDVLGDTAKARGQLDRRIVGFSRHIRFVHAVRFVFRRIRLRRRGVGVRICDVGGVVAAGCSIDDQAPTPHRPPNQG